MKDSDNNPQSNRAAPPDHLSEAAKCWWQRLTGEYCIDDTAGILLLTVAMESFDRMKAAAEILDREGLQTVDRFGQVRAHPMLIAERDARNALQKALASLHLDIEVGRPVGRPAGGG